MQMIAVSKVAKLGSVLAEAARTESRVKPPRPLAKCSKMLSDDSATPYSSGSAAIPMMIERTCAEVVHP